MLDQDQPTNPNCPTATDWDRVADSLARRVNWGWCIDRLVLALPIAAAVGTALVLYLRALGLAGAWIGLAAALPIVLALIYSWLRARRRFVGRRQALVRLESALQLDSALSSAAQGVASWPPLPAAARAVLRWRWERSFLPPACSVLLVAAALLWPLQPEMLARNSRAPRPRNLEALEKVLEQLKQAPLIAQEDLSTLDREIGRLKNAPGSLYNPSTLEAADHLAKRSAEALANLAKWSAAASRALQAAIDPQAGGKVRAKQADELEAAIAKMTSGAMKADPAMRDALKQAADNGMQGLDEASAKSLQELLEQNQQKFQELMEQLAPNLLGGAGGEPQGAGEGDPEGDGDRPGAGSAQHGDAPPAPLRFHRADRGFEGGKLEGLAPNPVAAAPGDLLELRAVTPPDPDAPAGPENAGSPSREGGGGARLWQENLDPDEQRFLGEFYR